MSLNSDIFHILTWLVLCETFAARESKAMQELLTYEDVSRITKFKISTLRKWVQLHKIPFSKINGAIRFDPEEIRAWVAGERGVEKRGGVAGAKGGAGELFLQEEEKQ
jgi:hypothetical protein